MHDTLFRQSVTLSDLLDAPGLELRLLSGGDGCRSAPVRGAHLTEILDPARWLDVGWVMFTTGLQMVRDAARQRRLIRDLATQKVTALGYCVGIATKAVPSALLDEARKLDYPLFIVPFDVPVRLAITHVNRLLLATDGELFDRAVTLNDYLLAGLDDAARSSLTPETHLVVNLRALLGLPVEYLDVTGCPVEPGQNSDLDLRLRLNSVSKQGTTKLQEDGQELLTVPCRLGTRLTGWLVVHLPSTMGTGQIVLAATQATAKLIAMAVVARQHSTENIDTLGQELMTWLLDRTAGTPVSESEDLEALSQTRALPVLHQLGFSAGEPIRALVVERAADTRTAAELRSLLRASKLAHLCVVRDGDFFAAVQGTGEQVRAVACRFGHLTGIGGAVSAITGLHRSLRQARFALQVIHRQEFLGQQENGVPRTYLDYDELPLAPWMAENARETAGDDRIGHYLRPLLAQPLLLEAVVQFLRHDQDIPAAARYLHLHTNSMRYRLERAEKALGVPLRRPSVLASLYVALTVSELL